MSENELDRSVLDSKDREELHAIAGAMGVRAATRMKKADLIDAILGAADNQSEKAGADGSDDDTSKPKRVRSRRASEVDSDPIAELAAEEDALAAAGATDADAAEPRTVSRASATSNASRGNGGGESGGGGGSATDTATQPANERATGDGDGGTATKPRIEPEDERQS